MIENAFSFPSRLPFRRGLLVMDARAALRPALPATACINTFTFFYCQRHLPTWAWHRLAKIKKRSGSLRLIAVTVGQLVPMWDSYAGNKRLPM
jgi:hypothetical protein